MIACKRSYDLLHFRYYLPEWKCSGSEEEKGMLISQRSTLYFWLIHTLVPGGSAVFHVLVIAEKPQIWIKEGLFTRMVVGTM